MLRTLHIENFQSHKDSTLTFDPNVNVIIGLSDSGKTAIIRAIRWLMWNRPQGDAIRSKWGGRTIVRLETDSDVIERWKDDGENVYRLNSKFDFKAIKTDVPDEIVKALNIDEINLQRQLDSPFLLSNTPGEVAQHFNRVANLNKIDTSLQAINGQIRELTNTIKYVKQEIEKRQEELKRFEYLEAFEAEVEVLEEMDRRKTNRLADVSKLESLCGSIRNKEAEIEEAGIILKLEQDVDYVLSLFDEEEKLSETYSMIQNSIEEIEEVEREIKENSLLLSLESSIDYLLSLYDEINALKSQQILLAKIIYQISNINISMKKKTAEIEKKQAEFEKEIGKMKICPLCNQIIQWKESE